MSGTLMTLISRWGISNPFVIWESVRTSSDLKDVNVAFLRGLLSDSPYTAKIASETLPLLGALIKINKSGIITVEGQPSSCEYDMKVPDDKYADVEQKSYMNAFIPKKMSNSLMMFLSLISGVYYSIQNDQAILNSNFPAGPYNLTRDRDYSKDNKSITIPWRYYTNIPQEKFDDEIYDLFKPFHSLHALFIDKYLFFQISLSKYCEGSVEDIMLSYLRHFKRNNARIRKSRGSARKSPIRKYRKSRK